MAIPPSIRDRCQAVENSLRNALASLRPDLPPDSISVATDEEGLLSARIYGVEQASHRSEEVLEKDTLGLFRTARRLYDHDEIAALLKTLEVIALKAGGSTAPESLDLVELPGGVLVLTANDRALAASEDPLHLLAQALAGLKSMRTSRL